jgi:hypothetical protein
MGKVTEEITRIGNIENGLGSTTMAEGVQTLGTLLKDIETSRGQTVGCVV